MLGEAVSMLIAAGRRVQAHGLAPGRRDRDRPRPHGHAAAAEGRRRGEVRRVLRSRPCRAAARRSRDDREHVARVRRHLWVLPRGRRDAQVPAPHGTRRAARRARRGVLQGERALARPGPPSPSIRRCSSSTSRTVEPSLAGPRRPQDRVPLRDAKRLLSRRAGELRRRLRQRARRGDGRVLSGERPPDDRRSRARRSRCAAVEIEVSAVAVAERPGPSPRSSTANSSSSSTGRS